MYWHLNEFNSVEREWGIRKEPLTSCKRDTLLRVHQALPYDQRAVISNAPPVPSALPRGANLEATSPSIYEQKQFPMALTSVLTSPGLTTLTRIGARSTASPRPRESIAPATPDIQDQPLRGLTITSPIVRVIDPPGRIFANCAATKAPQKRTSKAPLSQSQMRH